jgi:deoxyadenosine/deoxycytidine kinase
MGKLIVVTGNTGVGKSSLVDALAHKGLFNLGLEQHTQRPFQHLFSSNPQYALANQIDYLLFRAEQEHLLRNGQQPGLMDGGLDQDFHAFTRLFHSRGMLSDSEFDLCRRFYQFCRSQLPHPDLIIHINALPEILRQRLVKRDRINIASPDDLERLDSFLNEWLASIVPEKIIRLDVSYVSSSYSEVLPYLLSQIISQLQLDAGTYDTGYIP